ncbi:NAD-dependent epimerase/dehydratase family protein [Paenibacillus filicis]|uniref:NAD-dependent epimerase/dehydratase family protein n=1 Tax=Paenibacillus gyeongsangnamensis TaxID=3388067 RepID=A0ABT4Q9Q2_9BACL|nr:NAD-dependent epimerase/dehydratase family protein [Paenibacillus filicis]MCZ8513516.1 NAD-dependent epimerase/dehydratase family protein [Paenibacillus filicis]
MRVLILGGTGVISRCIADQLLDAGHQPVLFNRGSRKQLFSREMEWIIGDKTKPESFRQLMAGQRFDAVIDMISFNAADAAQTVETFRDKTGQLIFCSSTAAYKRPFRTIPVREDEEALCDSDAFPYAYHKAEMERYLQKVIAEGTVPITIIRPSLTFGEGGVNLGVLRQNRNIVHRIQQGKPLVMFGDGTLPWSFSFAPDVARAFVGAAGNERTFGKAYHATSEELHVWDDLYLEIGRLIGHEPKLVHFSTKQLMSGKPDLFAHLYYEKSYAGLFDNSKIKQDIPGFEARMTLSEGLRMMLDWYERDNLAIDEEKNLLEDRLAETYGRWCGELKELLSN